MQQTELEQEFKKYVEIGRDLPKQAPDVMLLAYGFFKQAIKGDNNQTRPTENSSVVDTLKYDQWKRLQGMTQSEAMTKYIAFIKELVVKNQAAVSKAK
jgi:acyl-CoA-binding protein